MQKNCSIVNMNQCAVGLYLIKNLIFNLTDFVNRKYDNPLGVFQDDLNIGGTGISSGNRGCHGQAHTQPKFRRGDIV